MARPNSKRKSEIALPTGKTKHRKTDDPGSSQDTGESSDQTQVLQKPVVPKYVKKTAVKSRKSEPVRAVRDEEYEEDEGRMESYQFLALVEYESRKKKRAAKAASEYMDRFQEALDSTADELKMRIANSTNDSTKQATAFLSTFQDRYARSRPLPPPSPNSKNANTNEVCFVTLFGRSQSLINNALEIITHFETAEDKTEKCEVAELLDNEWEKETGAAAQVLAIGCNVGLEKYQALLQGAGEPIVEEEEEVFVKMIYGEEGVTKDEYEYGWGKVAKKSEKAARKFVKFQRVVESVA